MIAAGYERMIREVEQSVSFGDKTFEVVKEFVYLGSPVTSNNDVSLEIQRRIQTANRCFFGLRKQLQSGHLSRSTTFICLFICAVPTTSRFTTNSNWASTKILIHSFTNLF
jgi:hypothetical protein